MDLPLSKKFKLILGNRPLGFILAALTILFFLCTAIQFWATQYYIEVLGLVKEQAFIYFAVLALTGPVLGAIIGGVVIGHIGGYNSPKAYVICLAVLVFTECFSIMIPFTNNLIASSAFLWL